MWQDRARKLDPMRRCATTLALVLGIAGTLNGQSILIDPFDDGDDRGWTRAEIPQSGGIWDATSGAYHFEAARDSFTLVGAWWNGSADPAFSNGFLRATARAETPETALLMAVRASLRGRDPTNITNYPDYNMFLFPHLAKMRITKGGTGIVLAEADLDIGHNEDWMMEAGAVGNELTFKAWRVGDPEPVMPQLSVNDSTHFSGMFGLGAGVPADVTGQTGATFDDVWFRPIPARAEPMTHVSPPGTEHADGNMLFFPVNSPYPTPGPRGTPDGWRAQELHPASAFESLGPVVITGVAWRPDLSVNESLSSTWELTALNLSTTPTQFASLSTTFADNYGSDGAATVFSGELELTTDGVPREGGSSQDFDYAIQFDTPYVYDPAQGNLLVEWISPTNLEDAWIWVDADDRTSGYVFAPAADADESFPPGAGLFVTEFTIAPRGDFDGNGALDEADVSALSRKIGGTESLFDLNHSGDVDDVDLTTWVKGLRNTWFGDANLDGRFDTGDLIEVFKAGKYELDTDAGWGEGDWTGDQRFGSSDLIAALQDGGYEIALPSIASAVPESSSAILLAIGILGLGRFRSSRVGLIVVFMASLLGMDSAARAQFITTVSPIGSEDTDGDLVAFPIGLSFPDERPAPSAGFRFQELHPTAFDSPDPGPFVITSMAWRPDLSVTATVSSEWEIAALNLSTTTTEPGSMSLTFADNYGTGGATTVFSGTMQFETDGLPTGGDLPHDFDYVFEFDTPYLHDPAMGNLLLEVIATIDAEGSFWIWTDAALQSQFTIGLNDAEVAFNSGPVITGQQPDAIHKLEQFIHFVASIPTPTEQIRNTMAVVVWIAIS